MENSSRMWVMTGRMPRRAAPRTTPVMAFSATGISSTRFGPYFSTRPLVEPKMAAASGAPSPTMNTRGSLAMQRSRASFSACTNFRFRMVTMAVLLESGWSRSWGVEMRGELVPRRERAGLCEGHRLVDLRGDRGHHSLDLRLAHHRALPAAGLVKLQGVASDPGVELPRGPISQVLIVEGATVLKPAVGLELDERRPRAAPGMSKGLAGHIVDGVGVVAVALQAQDAMPLGEPDDLATRGVPARQRRQYRVQVVLADHHHRKLVDGREVQALVEDAGLGGRIAEEDDGERRLTLEHRAQGRADANGNGAADDWHRPQEAR